MSKDQAIVFSDFWANGIYYFYVFIFVQTVWVGFYPLQPKGLDDHRYHNRQHCTSISNSHEVVSCVTRLQEQYELVVFRALDPMVGVWSIALVIHLQPFICGASSQRSPLWQLTDVISFSLLLVSRKPSWITLFVWGHSSQERKKKQKALLP